MLNIVLPMAGRGQRFVNAGFKKPKPLIEIKGKPMIDIVVQNISPEQEHQFIFIVLQEHIEQFALQEHLLQVVPNCKIVPVKQVTEGAACTVLLAKEFINNEDPLMIANCDQYIGRDINIYLQTMEQECSDGLIMTMKAKDTKWSFIKFDKKKNIVGVVEKISVSDEATVGIYNFSKGKDFVAAAEEMIKRNFRVNDEFYVAPVYNILLEKEYKISLYNVGSVQNGMYGLGTPEDLELFLKSKVVESL